MENQPKYEPLELSEFFPDRRSARPLVDGTVAWGEPGEDSVFATGVDENGDFVNTYPFEIREQVLQRGREQYDVYCSPCHGLSGYGDGMIVQRGFSPPSSFHIDRLREAPPGYIVNVIKNGFGQMYAYDYRVAPTDRWAIAAYIRALQLSQNATLEDVPEDVLPELQAAGGG